MFKNSQSGFTIIETILFLAISSLMIVVAALSIAGRTEEVQFTDAMRSTESFFEGKIDQVKTGSIARPDVVCRYNGTNYSTSGLSDGSCIFLGYFYRFNDLGAEVDPTRSEIDVYQMFGRRTSSTQFQECIDTNPNQKLFCARPVAIPDTPVETFTMPWSVEINSHTSEDVGNASLFGHLKDPTFSGSIIPMSVQAGSDGLVLSDRLTDWTIYRQNDEAGPGLSTVDTEVTALVCVTNNANRSGAIFFGQAERQAFVETEISSDRCSA